MCVCDVFSYFSFVVLNAIFISRDDMPTRIVLNRCFVQVVVLVVYELDLC